MLQKPDSAASHTNSWSAPENCLNSMRKDPTSESNHTDTGATDPDEVQPEELDLFNALTPQQRKQLVRHAASRRKPTTAIDYVVHLLEQAHAIKHTPAPSMGRRAENYRMRRTPDPGAPMGMAD